MPILRRRAAGAPAGWPSVTPRIFSRNPDGLVEFVSRVFGAKADASGDGPAVVTIGDSKLMISGTEFRRAMPAFLYVYVGDADAVYQRAMTAGAKSVEAPRDLPYGDRRGMVRDRWGNTWQIATRAKTVRRVRS